MKTLHEFMVRIKDDHRVAPVHVSLYIALLDCWFEQACPPFVRVNSQDMMRRSKIIARRSYYKYLRDLHACGLIEYRPEYYPGKTSLVGMNLISSPNDNFAPSFLLNHIRMYNKKSDDKRSVFELNDQEAAARFQLIADNIRKELFAKGLPITYQDDRCTTDDLFIQEYEDGRIHLVRLDLANQSYTLVKDLGNA